MARYTPGVFGFFLFVLWIWAVLDVIATDRILIRNLEKITWLFLVIFVPTVGAVAWIALGRPVNAGFTPGATYTRPARLDDPRPAPRGPEDSVAWRTSTTPSTPSASGESAAAKERRLMEWEAELQKRESDLHDPSDD